jgi:hypothetical protein
MAMQSNRLISWPNFAKRELRETTGEVEAVIEPYEADSSPDA